MSSFWNKIASFFVSTQPCKDAKKKENDLNTTNIEAEKKRHEAAMKNIENGSMCKPPAEIDDMPNPSTNPFGNTNDKANPNPFGNTNDKANPSPFGNTNDKPNLFGTNDKANPNPFANPIQQPMNGGRKHSKKSRRNKKKKTKRRR